MGTSYYVDTSYGLNAASSSIAGAMLVFVVITFIVGLALSIFMIISLWKVFEKAGKPGWAAIIPVYNVYVMCEIGNLPWWYLLLFLIPIVNIYAAFKVYDGISKRFGKTTGFTIGLLFLPFVFFAILAFGKNEEVVDGTQGEMGEVQNQPNPSESFNMTMPETPRPVMENQAFSMPISEPQVNVTMPNNNVTGNANYESLMPNMNQQPVNNVAMGQPVTTYETNEQVIQPEKPNSYFTAHQNNIPPKQPITNQTVGSAVTENLVNNVAMEQPVTTYETNEQVIQPEKPNSYFTAHQNNIPPKQPITNQTVGSVVTENLVNQANTVQPANNYSNNAMNVVEPVPIYDANTEFNSNVSSASSMPNQGEQPVNLQPENPMSADNFMIDESMTLDNDANQNNNQG